jgi:hypothetical protein
VAGFSAGTRNNHGLSVSHLLFSDDTLIFCGANEDQPRNLCCLFLCVEAVLGLKINLTKSKIVLIGKVEDVDRLASIFGCRVAGLPMKYLGFPLGAPYKSTTIWNKLSRKWEGNWQVGRNCIYQRVGGSH